MFSDNTWKTLTHIGINHMQMIHKNLFRLYLFVSNCIGTFPWMCNVSCLQILLEWLYITVCNIIQTLFEGEKNMVTDSGPTCIKRNVSPHSLTTVGARLFRHILDFYTHELTTADFHNSTDLVTCCTLSILWCGIESASDVTFACVTVDVTAGNIIAFELYLNELRHINGTENRLL